MRPSRPTTACSQNTPSSLGMPASASSSSMRGMVLPPSGRRGLRSEPGLDKVPMIAASDSGRCAVEACSTAPATPMQIATATEAPSAGQNSRMSTNSSRRRTAKDASRSARTRISVPATISATAWVSSLPDRCSGEPRRSEAPIWRMSSTRKAQVRHQRRCDSMATCSAIDSSSSRKASSMSRACSQPTYSVMRATPAAPRAAPAGRG